MGTKYENETHICRIIENLQLEMVYKITNQLYLYQIARRIKSNGPFFGT